MPISNHWLQELCFWTSGKTKIPTALLQKEGPLEAHEFEEVKRHVEYGLQILDESGNVDPNVATILRTHHERHDGSGYPDGLAGNDIPVFGRIAGIIDTFDAMTTIRPHAAAMSTYDVMRHLLDNADILLNSGAKLAFHMPERSHFHCAAVRIDFVRGALVLGSG